jgi:integrase
MDAASVHRWFKRCTERAGLQSFPSHELRHSAAQALWRKTGNLVLAQELLRHEDIGMTRAYLHPSLEGARSRDAGARRVVGVVKTWRGAARESAWLRALPT